MASVSKRSWVRDGKIGESWQVSWTEGDRRRKKAGFKTKKEANAWGTDKEKALLDGVSRPKAHRITVYDLSRDFLADLKARLDRKVIGEGHYIVCEGHLYNYIVRNGDWVCRASGAKTRRNSANPSKYIDFDGGIGHLTIDLVRPSTIEKLRDKLLETGLNHKTVRGIITTMHSMFEFARRRDLIAANPASRISVQAPRDKRLNRVTPPTIAAVRAAIEAADEPLRLMIEAAAVTGLRSGELRALRYKNIDSVKRMLKVESSLNLRLEEGPPKSRAGYRTVPLSQRLAERFDQHRKSAKCSGDEDIVFPNERGGFLASCRLLTRLYAIFDRLGWPQEENKFSPDRSRFHWHALRHYAITNWIAAGLAVKVVQTFAGHADITTTMDRYGHLFPEDDHSIKVTAAEDRTFGYKS
jgi:integrase